MHSHPGIPSGTPETPEPLRRGFALLRTAVADLNPTTRADSDADSDLDPDDPTDVLWAILHGMTRRMTLGSGARHSEQNASAAEPMRFIQIWILPETADLEPSVEQQVLTAEDRTDRLLEVVDPHGGPSVVKVHQDARVLVSRLHPGTEVGHRIGEGRGVYAYLIGGQASFDGEPASTGDAAKVTGQDALRIRATAQSELILVDVPLDFQRVGFWANRW